MANTPPQSRRQNPQAYAICKEEFENGRTYSEIAKVLSVRLRIRFGRGQVASMICKMRETGEMAPAAMDTGLKDDAEPSHPKRITTITLAPVPPPRGR